MPNGPVKDRNKPNGMVDFKQLLLRFATNHTNKGQKHAPKITSEPNDGQNHTPTEEKHGSEENEAKDVLLAGSITTSLNITGKQKGTDAGPFLAPVRAKAGRPKIQGEAAEAIWPVDKQMQNKTKQTWTVQLLKAGTEGYRSDRAEAPLIKHTATTPARIVGNQNESDAVPFRSNATETFDLTIRPENLQPQKRFLQDAQFLNNAGSARQAEAVIKAIGNVIAKEESGERTLMLRGALAAQITVETDSKNIRITPLHKASARQWSTLLPEVNDRLQQSNGSQEAAKENKPAQRLISQFQPNEHAQPQKQIRPFSEPAKALSDFLSVKTSAANDERGAQLQNGAQPALTPITANKPAVGRVRLPDSGRFLHEVQQVMEHHIRAVKTGGARTALRITSSPVGSMEVQFEQHAQKGPSLTVLVESEAARAEFQRLTAQIQTGLQDKGIHINSIEVEVASFGQEQSTSGNSSWTQDHNRNQNQSPFLQEEEYETPSSAVNPKNYGYNTIELIA